MDSNLIAGLQVWALPVILAICFHEAAHGYVAWRLGDDTAKRLGRVSINPLKHIDTFGTIILPFILFLAHSPFLFGYAKPVPVNFSRLRHPRSDMVWVALAGPAINIFLALISATLLHLFTLVELPHNAVIIENIINMIKVNVVLAVITV
jgi:Zn-dependent protease